MRDWMVFETKVKGVADLSVDVILNIEGYLIGDLNLSPDT